MFHSFVDWPNFVQSQLYENLTTSPVAQRYEHAGRSLLKLAKQQRTG